MRNATCKPPLLLLVSYGRFGMLLRPSEGDPIGPMALEATCTPQGDSTLLHLRQSGYDKSSPRWTRHYDIVAAGWIPSPDALKKYLEDRWAD